MIKKVLLVLILLLAAFLLCYRISDLMPFIGDYGWFYLSARDMLLTGNIPLVGITSSHVWLHQGALWTYMLAMMLWLFHFNPVSGAYLTIGLGIVTVFILYKVATEMFSERIGLLAALFYATSPLIILYARAPYHTSPIPFLALLLFYVTYKWMQGFRYGFPLIILLYALLYNFEIATITLLPLLIVVLVYGIWKRKPWIKHLKDRKIIVASVIAYLIPMTPMLLYDIHHGFPQTLKVVEWIGYKIAIHFGYPKLHANSQGENFPAMWRFGTMILQRIIYLKSALVAWLLLLFSFGNVFNLAIQKVREKEYLHPYVLLFLFFTFPVLGYISARTNSEAYLAILFPFIALVIALLFERMMQFRILAIPALVIILLIAASNIFYNFKEDFLMFQYGYGPTLGERMKIAKMIVTQSNGRAYNIIARGHGSEYASFTMNYEYLTWWLGHGPSHRSEPLKFIIQEKNGHGILQKIVKK